MTDSPLVLSSTAGTGESDPASMGTLLRNAQPYDVALVSSDHGAEQLARRIYGDLLAGKGAPRFLTLRGVITSVLLNLFSAFAHDRERFVRYSRDPHHYNKQSKYNPLAIGWTNLKHVVKALNLAGLIEHHCGVFAYTEFAHGRQSRMRATPKLAQLMTHHQFSLDKIQIVDSDEVIMLKDSKDEDGNARLVEYQETSDTRRMRSNLLKINKLMAGTDIRLELGAERIRAINQRLSQTKDRFPLNFLHKRLKRVFNNNSFQQGGRFYRGWWESIPWQERAFITINGEQIVEIDFTGIHFCIFYGEVGLELHGDPYTLPGTTAHDRDVIKAGAQVMINAADTQEAVKGLQRKAQEDGLSMPQGYPDARALIEALAQKHAPIRHLFCSGAGTGAQFVDSKIAETVMLSMAAEGIPVLPVHDSFLAPAGHRQKLCETMLRAYATITGGKCSAKTKPHIRLGEHPSYLHADEI